MEYGVYGLHGTIVILHVEEAVGIEIGHVQNQYHNMVENIVVAMIQMLYEIKVCVLLSTVVELICTIRILHSCDKTKSKHTTPSEQSQIYYENRGNRARSTLL
jgi:ammonia channel protein AmtB